MMKENYRLRVWSSRGSTGSIFVEDGTMPLANGHETGWYDPLRREMDG
jgi:hypothetical protein